MYACVTFPKDADRRVDVRVACTPAFELRTWPTCARVPQHPGSVKGCSRIEAWLAGDDLILGERSLSLCRIYTDRHVGHAWQRPACSLPRPLGILVRSG